MANKIFNTRVKNKRDTEANWKIKNPVLLDGEIIIVTTTSGDTRFKVGDGKKTYNQLPFQDQKTRDLIPSVDSSLSSTSTNPVQNKIIKSELDKKAERDVVNTTTNGLMSVADKKKLDGIAAGANKITVDDALNATSKNPVQNQAVYAELNNKLSKSGGTLTGNLSGKYIAGTWLQTTEATDLGRTPGKIAVLDESGWVYYRTPLELLADLGTETVDQILGLVYPVGSIYMSINNVSPVTLFGGKWVQIQGRFLLGASDVYKARTAGGEATHTLTENEIPAHAHYMAANNPGGNGTWTPDVGSHLVSGVTDDQTTFWAQLGMNNAGGGIAHNNMPPYLVVYMWRRLA